MSDLVTAALASLRRPEREDEQDLVSAALAGQRQPTAPENPLVSEALQRVKTNTLTQQGITAEEVKRRAAAGEPIVQSGLRPPTASENVRAVIAATAGGAGQGLGGLVGLAADALTAPTRGAIAGVEALREGKSYPEAVGASGRAAVSMPVTRKAVEAGEDAERTFNRAMGVDEGVATTGLTNVARLAADIAVPGPTITQARRAAPITRKAPTGADEAVRTAEPVLAEEGARLSGGPEINPPKEDGTNAAWNPEAPPPPVEPESFPAHAKRTLKPLESQPKEVRTLFSEWDRTTKLAREQANAEVKKLAQIPEKQGLKVILDYEKGIPTPFSGYIRDTFARLADEAKAKGFEFDVRENYIPQAYKNKPQEVRAAMIEFMKDQGVDESAIKAYIDGGKDLPEEVSRRLGLNPSFTKQRVFPDYETAMKYGLTPKFTHPAQLAAQYRHNMNVVEANRNLFDGLVHTGRVMPYEQAPNGWKPITLNFSPKGMAAEPKLADMLNGYFRDENTINLGERIAKGVARTSRLAQEVALSAGVPYTQVNFFAIGQFIKELTAGNFKAAVPFARSNFSGATTQYFAKNHDTLEQMARNGIDLGSRMGQYEKVYENLAEKGVFEHLGAGEVRKAAGTAKDKVARRFGEAFNEKVFGSFIPQLYMQTFKDAKKRFVKKGLDASAAEAKAAETVRAFYGVMENVGRGKGTEDAMTAALFAPKFREGVVNALWNTAQSVNPIKKLGGQAGNPAFYKNQRLLTGMALSYAAYNAANKELTGHYMWDNPPGKEFALQIPMGDGENYVYVEFMPSFLAFARNMASGAIATVKGDFNTATQKFGSLASIPAKLTSEMWANRDYFGRPIYDEYDPSTTKVQKLAAHAGLQVSHPFMREFVKQKFTDKDKPLYQSISEAAELPLKFGSETQIQKNRYYQLQREMRAARRRELASAE